jgi:hypothetical protein
MPLQRFQLIKEVSWKTNWIIMNKRRLKVREVGDFYRRKTRPELILSGKWLEEMGIKRETYVEVSSPKPGTVVIQSTK